MSIGIYKHLNWDEANNTIYKHFRRRLCGCDRCKPHGGENSTRYGRHGKTKPKYKSHRK